MKNHNLSDILYQVLVSIDASTVSEEEVGAGFPGNCGLDPGNGFGYGPELEGSNTSGSQEWREHHVVPRRNTNDVVGFGVNAFHKPASGPTGAQNHHPGLLAALSGSQPLEPWITSAGSSR